MRPRTLTIQRRRDWTPAQRIEQAREELKWHEAQLTMARAAKTDADAEYRKARAGLSTARRVLSRLKGKR